MNCCVVMSVNFASVGDVLPSGEIKAAKVTVADASINDTYNTSCLRAPILKPCSLYGGLVACELYP